MKILQQIEEITDNRLSLNTANHRFEKTNNSLDRRPLQRLRLQCLYSDQRAQFLL